MKSHIVQIDWHAAQMTEMCNIACGTFDFGHWQLNGSGAIANIDHIQVLFKVKLKEKN